MWSLLFVLPLLAAVRLMLLSAAQQRQNSHRLLSCENETADQHCL
jgi:hypothetical protein